MSEDWHPLRRELAAWRTAGLTPHLWWRDDDAVMPTPALDRLEGLAAKLDVPVHLAVIPRDAGPALAERVAGSAHLVPVVHGWSHANHASPGAKKAEFGQPRRTAAEDLTRGLKRLRTLFGVRLQPLFVPPWNRLDACFLPVLKEIGYEAVSIYGPADLGHILPFVNTHLDPIDWHGTRGLVPSDTLIGTAVVQLQRQRRAAAPAGAFPFGLLSHHLVQDAALWTFCERFLAEMLSGGAVTWAFGNNPEVGDEQT